MPKTVDAKRFGMLVWNEENLIGNLGMHVWEQSHPLKSMAMAFGNSRVLAMAVAMANSTIFAKFLSKFFEVGTME